MQFSSWLSLLPLQVVATDVSQGMIDRLQQNLSTRTNPNIRGQQADGMTLEGLEDNSFDAVFSNLAVIFFPDRVKGDQAHPHT